MIEKIEVVRVGNASQRSVLTMKGGSFLKKKYPIYCVILQHDSYGSILIDTGYGPSFLASLYAFPRMAYQRFFMKGAQAIIPKSSVYQKQFDWLLLSHFHPDHIGGLREVQYKYLQYSNHLKKLQSKKRFTQLRKGFFKELLPKCIEPTSYFEQKKLVDMSEYGFKNGFGYDLFGDQSVLALSMSGHAEGQYIFYLKTTKGPVLFGVDVAWHIETIQESKMPSSLTCLIVHHYQTMIQNIKVLQNWHSEHTNIPILLSHCAKSLDQLVEWDHKKGGQSLVFQEE